MIVDTTSNTSPRRQRQLLPPRSLTPAAKRAMLAGICGILGCSLAGQGSLCASRDTSGSLLDPGKCAGLTVGIGFALLWLVMVIYTKVRKYFKRRAYRKWLETFNDGWDGTGAESL